MYDSLVSDVTALTSSAASDAIDLKNTEGLVVRPMVCRIHYAAAVTSSTVKAMLQQSSDASNWEDLTLVHDTYTVVAADNARPGFVRRKRFVPNKRYVRVNWTTATSPNFGNVTVDIGVSDNDSLT